MNNIKSTENIEYNSFLNQKAENEKNKICNEFISALESCIVAEKYSYVVKFSQFYLFKYFDLKDCLDQNNDIKINGDKFNVKFNIDSNYHSVPEYRGTSVINGSNYTKREQIRNIKVVKNQYYEEKKPWRNCYKTEFKFIVS